MPQVTEFIEQYRRDWRGQNRRSSCGILKRDLKISSRRKRKVGKTSEMIEGFCFISITGHSRPIAGKDADAAADSK